MHSKNLGSVRENNKDKYVNEIIKNIYNLNSFDDDSGLEITKQLLNENNTTGIDLDLFQYVKTTNEYIIYEFLKRETDYVTNKTAHPMRYCWTKNRNDNKKKFISLWQTKNYFGGKLYLINYSDNKEEDISIIEVLNLNEETGFLEENKYCMCYDEFIKWIEKMNMYNKKK